MRRGPVVVLVDVVIIVIGALLSAATNFATSSSGHLPTPLALLRNWSLPVAGALLLLLLVGRVVTYRLDRPRPLTQRAWDPDHSPFPGLEAFNEKDADVFFGRDADIELMIDRLHPAVPVAARRIVPIVGPSGSGKSSLVQAGLLPRLARRRKPWAIVGPFTPESSPVESLRRATDTALDGLLPSLDTANDLATAVRARRGRAGVRRNNVLIVVDQAEELMTLASSGEAAKFLSLLGDAVSAEPSLWVVLVLRSDFLTELVAVDPAAALREPIVIGPLDHKHLYRVIQQPAEQAGVRFEPPGLVNRMVDDTGTGEALPLLAYTLSELWRRAGSGRVIDETRYDELGGVAGALAQRATQVRDALLATDPQAPVIQTLLRFVTVADTSTPTRRRVARTSLRPRQATIADAFVEARLLVREQAAGAAEPEIHVAHEALFSAWPPLRQAIENEIAHLQLRHRAESWALEWADSGRKPEYLLRGDRLSSVQQWIAADPELTGQSTLVQELVTNSAKADAELTRRSADATASAVLETLSKDPEAGLLAALAAVSELTATPMVHQAVVAALMVCPARGVVAGHTSALTAVAWSPRGSDLLTAALDGTVVIHDVTAGTLRYRLDSLGSGVLCAVWSPNGDRVATGCQDGTVAVWSLVAEPTMVHLNTRCGPVSALSWSARSDQLAIGCDSGRIGIAAAGSLTDVQWAAVHAGAVTALSWSPDGRLLASGSRDRRIVVHDAARTELLCIQGSGHGATRQDSAGHAGGITSVAWSPEGRCLASASDDWMVRTWHVASGMPDRSFEGHDDSVLGVTWSPDGSRLASCSRDRTIRVWDSGGGPSGTVLRGHTNAVSAVAWSESGDLASASADQTARIWSPDARILSGHIGAVRSVTWSPDGSQLASASFDGGIRFWDAVRRVELKVRRVSDSQVVFVNWSPDGTRLAATYSDGSVRIHRLDETTSDITLKAHDALVTWVAWSNDSSVIASCSLDRTLRIWDAGTGHRKHEFQYEDAVTWAAWSPTTENRFAVAVRAAGVYIGFGAELDHRILLEHDADVWGAGWSRDGGQLATAGYDGIGRRWVAATGELLGELRGHEDGLCAITWSPDGNRIATSSLDRTVRIWDSHTNTESMVLRGHEGAVWGLAWSPDGSTIATGSDDRTVRLWPSDTSLDAMLTEARRYAVRPLTAAERERFHLRAHAR